VIHSSNDLATGLVSSRHDVNTPTISVEHHMSFDQSEQRVIFTLADIFPRVEAISNLANENVAGVNVFATVFLYTATLSV